MKFSIITPTHKRADKLARAVASAQAQTYQDWEMIIVNDSPNDESYRPFASSINDPRIHYHVNGTNSGVNFTRNFALNHVSADSKWVIFLDDDDYLAPDALDVFHELIRTHPKRNWFFTNRAYKDERPVTQVKHSDADYSYIWDILLLRRIKGDAIHAIKMSCLHRIRFSKRVKQAEEWIFFYQLGLAEKMFYHDHNSTFTDGYDTKDGLNFRRRARGERFEDVSKLFYEGIELGIAHHPTFFLYLFARCIRLILR